MNPELSPLPFRVGAQTHVGHVREENQDNMSRFVCPLGEVFLVVDGMGGHQGGAEAARRVVDGLERHLSAVPAGSAVARALQQAAAATHAEILAAAAGEIQVRSMGATAVLALIHDRQVWIAHAGDSRAYLLRAGGLHRLTQDHTRIQQMIDHQILTEEQARDHPDASVIQRAFGQGDTLELEVAPPREMAPGDRWLLCTDGLSGYVRDDAIATALGGAGEAQALAGRLVELALAAGGEDNVTVQVVAVAGEAPSPRPAALAPARAADAPTVSGSVAPARSSARRGWLLVAVLVALAFALGAYFGRPALEALRERLPWLQRQKPARQPPSPAPGPGKGHTPAKPPVVPALAEPPALVTPPALASDDADDEGENAAEEPVARPGIQAELLIGKAPVLLLQVIESVAPKPGEPHPLGRRIARFHSGTMTYGRLRPGASPATVYYRPEIPGAKAEALKIAQGLGYRSRPWPAALGADDPDTALLVVERPAAPTEAAAPTGPKEPSR